MPRRPRCRTRTRWLGQEADHAAYARLAPFAEIRYHQDGVRPLSKAQDPALFLFYGRVKFAQLGDVPLRFDEHDLGVRDELLRVVWLRFANYETTAIPRL